MYFFNFILVTLIFVGSLSGRPMDSGLEEGQNLEQLQSSPDKVQQVSQKDDLIRILLGGSQFVKGSPEEASAEKDLRLKRSLYPYTAGYQMTWPQIEGTNSWRANLYPAYFVSVNGLENGSSKYAYLGNGDHQTKTKTPDSGLTRENLTKAMPDRSGKEDTGEKPTWDVKDKKTGDDKPIWMTAAYRKNSQKTSRFSRASNDEKEPDVTPLPPSFRRDGQMSDKMIYFTHQYFDRNEIPIFPFHSPKSEKPGRCTWAILACCSTSSDEVNHSCFRRLDCEEHFWNLELCRADFVQMAMEVASIYFKKKGEK